MSSTHVRWCSIELLHNVVRTLNYLQERDGTPLPSVTYRGKVKLHGTNCAVQVTEDGDVVPQSRSQLLVDGQDYKGFAQWVHQRGDGHSRSDNRAYFASLERGITIFGEWCGPGVEKGMGISKIDRKVFAVFAIQRGYGEDARIVYEPDAIWRCLNGPSRWMPKDMFILPWHGALVTLRYGDEKGMEHSVEVINNMVAGVECCDPWVKETFGVEGIGEGIVFYPVGDGIPVDPEGLAMLMFKAKGDKHREVGAKRAAQVKPEKAAGVDEFVALVVTEARLQQGVSEACGGAYEMRQMGSFMRWVTADVQKESVAELEASGLTWKQVAKGVQAKARDWYKAASMS